MSKKDQELIDNPKSTRHFYALAAFGQEVWVIQFNDLMERNAFVSTNSYVYRLNWRSQPMNVVRRKNATTKQTVPYHSDLMGWKVDPI